METHILPLEEILDRGFFVVPRFQRDYAWTVDEVQDLWQDAFEQADDPLFIGSIVAYRQPTGPRKLGIVDGQQRLTTMTILLCVVRNKMKQCGLESNASGLHATYIQKKNKDDENVYVLSADHSYPFMIGRIQSYEPNMELEPSNAVEQRLADAFRFLTEKVDSTIETIANNNDYSDKERAEKIKSKLVEIRDKALGVKAVFLITDSEEESITAFETLNARGKDLQVADLLKALLVRLCPKKGDVDTAKDRWVALQVQFEREGLDFDAFLVRSWLSRRSLTSKPKLYELARKTIVKKPGDDSQVEALEYIKQVERDAKIYIGIFSGDIALPKSARRLVVPPTVGIANILGVSQPIPALLAIFRAVDDARVKPKDAAKYLRQIEAFHFKFTRVMSRTSTGGVSGTYSAQARKLSGLSGEEALEVLADLCTKLRSKLPANAEFIEAFAALRFNTRNEKERAFAKYILENLAKKEAPEGLAFDFSSMSIEHLLPLSSDADGALIESIGNLILVTPALNSKLGAKPFPEKQKILIDNGVYLPSVVGLAKDWGKNEILNLARERAGQAWEIWEV